MGNFQTKGESPRREREGGSLTNRPQGSEGRREGEREKRPSKMCRVSFSDNQYLSCSLSAEGAAAEADGERTDADADAADGGRAIRNTHARAR